MAKLRVAPETLLQRMFPGKKLTLSTISYDRNGDLGLELEGDDVPASEHITAEITNHTSYERIEFKAS